MKRVLIGIVGAAVLGLFASTASAQDTAKGAKVYADQKCSLCHSIAGKGNAKGALDDVGSKLTAAEIHDWIVKPAEMTAKAKAERKPPMPAYPPDKLSDEDLTSLTAYLLSLKK